MLVLTRKSEESVMVGNAIEIKVLHVKGDQVSLGFKAPREISIHRKEVYEAIQTENQEAAERGSGRADRLFASLNAKLQERKIIKEATIVR